MTVVRNGARDGKFVSETEQLWDPPPVRECIEWTCVAPIHVMSGTAYLSIMMMAPKDFASPKE